MGSGTVRGKRMGDGHKTAPTTVPEIGIHIGYMREDLSEIKNALANSPSRREFNDLKTEVEGKVSRKEVIAIASVAGFVATVLGIVISLITIYQRLGGQ